MGFINKGTMRIWSYIGKSTLFVLGRGQKIFLRVSLSLGNIFKD